jgi:surface protein
LGVPVVIKPIGGIKIKHDRTIGTNCNAAASAVNMEGTASIAAAEAVAMQQRVKKKEYELLGSVHGSPGHEIGQHSFAAEAVPMTLAVGLTTPNGHFFLMFFIFTFRFSPRFSPQHSKVFYMTESSNTDIFKWQTGAVTDLAYGKPHVVLSRVFCCPSKNFTIFFYNAQAFNSDLSTWDVSITSLETTFMNAIAFNPNLCTNNDISNGGSAAPPLYVFSRAAAAAAIHVHLLALLALCCVILWVAIYMYILPGCTIEVYGHGERQKTRLFRVATFGKKRRGNVQRLSGQENQTAAAWLRHGFVVFLLCARRVMAVCTPSDRTNLVLAVNACLLDSTDGNCVNFAAASNGNGCGSAGGVNGAIGAWDVSGVVSMQEVFYIHKWAFNADLSNWNVRAVTNMYRMFNGASEFNGDVSKWNVAAVTNMNQMFDGASVFNGDVSKWNVAAVNAMSHMFRSTLVFNGDLSKWNVGAVTGMTEMFKDSGFARTLCGSKWASLTGTNSAFNSLGTNTARLGCCSAGSFMLDPNLNPFSLASSCGLCPTGQFAPAIENSRSNCRYDRCSVDDGSTINSGNCACGTSGDCDSSSGLFCLSSLNQCNTKRMCTKIDGLFLNSENCACGTSDCDSTSGLYCYFRISRCSTNIITKFTPADRAALRPAVVACITETRDGSCPTFVASNDATGNPYGWMGDWDVSGVVSMQELFFYASWFNADVSKWNTGAVTSIDSSKCTLSPSLWPRRLPLLCF